MSATGAETLLRLIIGGRDEAADRASRVATAAGRQAIEIRDIVSRFASELSDAVLAQGKTAKAGAEEQFEAARVVAAKQAQDVGRVLAGEVKARPLQTLLLVAAAGIVVGWLAKNKEYQKMKSEASI